MAFQPLPVADIMASVKAVHNETDKLPSKEEASQEPHSTFRPCPNTKAADSDFEKEIKHLHFKLNLRDIPLEKEHQVIFLFDL